MSGLVKGSRASALATMAERYGVETEKLLPILKNTVIKPSKNHTPSDSECAAFVIVANQYGLNPFTREIHAFADSQRGVVPIVGVDGWCRIVNSHPQFDGVEFLEHVDQDGSLVAMTCTMHVKGRGHPVQITEYLRECKRNTIPWQQMPVRMLRHKAYMQAARLAFSIGGLYDEDEAEDLQQQSSPPASVASVTVGPLLAAECSKSSKTAKLVERIRPRMPELRPVEPPAEHVDVVTGEVTPVPAPEDDIPFEAAATPTPEPPTEPVVERSAPRAAWTVGQLLDAQDGDCGTVRGHVRSMDHKATRNGKSYVRLGIYDGPHTATLTTWGSLPDWLQLEAAVEIDWKSKSNGKFVNFQVEEIRQVEAM